MGHSLEAQKQGIKVNSITLFLFGGIAAIEEESKTPGQAFQVAIAGPLVSIGLFLFLRLTSEAIPDNIALHMMLRDLGRINLVLALFNLIPGLPLDGGQVLKAALWKVTGNRFKAVRMAARAGQILGYAAIALGLVVDYLTGELITGLWIALLGWFGIRNATTYLRVSLLQETLLNMVASDAMTREFRVVDAEKSLRSFADEYLLASNQSQVFFADRDGRYQGMVCVDDLRIIERSSPAGAIAGLVDRGDILRSLASKLNLRIGDADIKRVKEEGSYPPGLQLGMIAKSTLEDVFKV